MTPLINFTEPFAILTATVLFVLILLLAKETKKSVFPAIMLGIFMLIIVGHAIEYALVKENLVELQKMIANCITVDFVFVFLSFISYLWIDDIEAKENKKKSIDNSLEWFWTKV